MFYSNSGQNDDTRQIPGRMLYRLINGSKRFGPGNTEAAREGKILRDGASSTNARLQLQSTES